jgi:hypothetical protein
MMWTVTSHRLSWSFGSEVGADDLEGCNIDALVQGGHLAPVENRRTPSEQVPDSRQYRNKAKPVAPVTENDSAEEPEEQE